MGSNDLLAHKTDIERRFDELSKNKTDLEDEMKRLQGEHRLLVNLINTEDSVEVLSDIAPKKRIRKVIEPDAKD